MGNKVTREERDQQYRELEQQFTDQAWAIVDEDAPFLLSLDAWPTVSALKRALILLARDDLGVVHLGFD